MAGSRHAALRPFWRYFGGKWRAVSRGLYPQPLHRTIVEPFAGAAGYSLHYSDANVILVERYHVVAEMWRWLIAVKPSEVRRIPLVDDVDDLPRWVSAGGRSLVGFSMNAATATPRKALARSGALLRARGRRFYGWTDEFRERVADQVQRIKHWRLIEGDYTDAPDVEATWFVDAPYEEAGHEYVHGSRGINYPALASWCRARRGQPIVCESPKAKWLQFRSIGTVKSGPRTRLSVEGLWP